MSWEVKSFNYLLVMELREWGRMALYSKLQHHGEESLGDR
jgi:hypothetical protein